jgi:uncharacterized membrane protein
MNEQDLINIWKTQDSDLEKSIHVNQELLKTVTLEKVKSMLTLFRRTNIFELIINFLFLFWLVSFIKNNLSIAYFWVSAGFLCLMMLSSIIFNIYNLYLIKSIALNDSILETQRKIEQMKLHEKWSINALYIIIPLAPVPFLLVLGKGILGIDLYQILGTTYLWSFTLGSLLVAIIIVWLVKKFPNEEMKKASNFLKEISELK